MESTWTISTSAFNQMNHQQIPTAGCSSSRMFDDHPQPAVKQATIEEWMKNADTWAKQHTDQNGNAFHEYVAVHNVQSNSFGLSTSNNQVYRTLSTSTFQSHKLLGVEVVPQKKSYGNLDYVVGEAVAKNGKTLYCKAKIMVPFMFTYGNECDPCSRIQVRAEFMEKIHIKKPVERCPNHLLKDESSVKMYFVRCGRADTEYLGFNENYALRIPLCESAGFMFTCYSSCSGGINRRPIQLTFILEGVDGSYMNMFSLPLKVCANPSRDAFKEGPLVQRKERQAAGKDGSKRQIYQGYSYDSSRLYEIHFCDPVKMMKCLWYLANEEKFDQLACMDVEGNPFRDVCVINRDTSIKAWLNKLDTGLLSHADIFERQSIFTLGDLASVYDANTFTRLGFEPSQCAVLNTAFQNWHHENRTIATRHMNDGRHQSLISYSVTNM